MRRTLLLALISLLILPAAASGATVNANVKRHGGTTLGPVTFKAAKGEANRVTVTDANGRLRFHDSANPVRARGDCTQVDRHTALCPFTEDIAKIKLADREDHAAVEGLVEVLGGAGHDVLNGSAGNDRLNGQRGDDKLYGRKHADVLTGGPGYDLVVGGGGDDDLIDGETDRQAAGDLYLGGSSRDTRNNDRGDQIDYSLRKRGLRVDLANHAVHGPDRDFVHGLESVVGGSGDDVLRGDGDDNWLEGNGGNDLVRGRGGDDIPQGGKGADRVLGDDGHDVVWGDGGADTLSGGDGDDLVIARDSNPEKVDCGAGGDDDAAVTRLDTLTDCERATSSVLQVRVQPDVQGNTATFQVSCVTERGCSGTIALTSTTGEDYGSGSFSGIPHGADTFTPVDVDLTPAGKQALHQGELVQVTYPGATGGYRAFLGG